MPVPVCCSVGAMRASAGSAWHADTVVEATLLIEPLPDGRGHDRIADRPCRAPPHLWGKNGAGRMASSSSGKIRGRAEAEQGAPSRAVAADERQSYGEGAVNNQYLPDGVGSVIEQHYDRVSSASSLIPRY